MSDLNLKQRKIEAAARALYMHWLTGDSDEAAVDWAAWDIEAPLNGYGLRPAHFREDAEAIIDLDIFNAARELCWRGAGCAGIECPTIDSCKGDEYFRIGAHRALKAAKDVEEEARV